MKYAVIAFALALAGCTPSLSPLFTDTDTYVDPALAGTWLENGGDGKFFCAISGDRGYRITYSEAEGNPAAFTGRLVRLGEHLFFDLYPDEPAGGNGFYKGHLVRAHSFGRLSLEGDTLRLYMMDSDWLNDSHAAIGHT